MDRGEIWKVDLDPTRGREQRGFRPILIVSPSAFNRLGTPLICPIATAGHAARYAGWAVSLMGAGTETTGVVLVNQLRALDVQNRSGRRFEAVPEHIMDEVLARLRTLFE